MAEDVRMTIHFTDNSSLSLIFPRVAESDTLSSRIESLLKNQYLLLEVEDSVMMFPFHNVKYIQTQPAPDPLPPNINRTARIQD
ncbi:MAG TPA: hypothetical protein VEV20_12130 [Burkholderiales bacterium]|nr:hypothetical protein [Burkholderiales bacterium]